MRSAAERGRFWILLIVVVVLDRVTKVMAEAALAGDRIINVVGDVFRLRLVYNPGAAFGIHVGAYSRWFFLVVAIVAVWLLRRMWIEASPTDTLRRWAVAIVAGRRRQHDRPRPLVARCDRLHRCGPPPGEPPLADLQRRGHRRDLRCGRTGDLAVARGCRPTACGAGRHRMIR